MGAGAVWLEGQRDVVDLFAVELNAALPANRFDPPADVQKLIDAKAKK